jgi:hypothetical protein
LKKENWMYTFKVLFWNLILINAYFQTNLTWNFFNKLIMYL